MAFTMSDRVLELINFIVSSPYIGAIVFLFIFALAGIGGIVGWFINGRQ